MSEKYTMFDAATDLEETTTYLEQLLSLLQLYEEHRESELGGLDEKCPSSITTLINRREMGYALLTAIQDKVMLIHAHTHNATENGYAAAKADKLPEQLLKEVG